MNKIGNIAADRKIKVRITVIEITTQPDVDSSSALDNFPSSTSYFACKQSIKHWAYLYAILYYLVAYNLL